MQKIKEQTISNEKDLLKFYFVYAKYKKNVEEIEVPEELTNKVRDDLVRIEVGKICEKLGDIRTLTETKTLRLQGVMDRVTDLVKQAKKVKSKVLEKKKSLRASF